MNRMGRKEGRDSYSALSWLFFVFFKYNSGGKACQAIPTGTCPLFGLCITYF